MTKIAEKKVLADIQSLRIVQLEVFSPDIAKEAKAGQFVVIMAVEEGERIPLTVVSADKDKGIITLIFHEAGFTTKLLGNLNAGDSLYAIAGPLGDTTEIKNYGKVILIGGGVGIAEIFPVARALKDKNNYLVSILGTKTKDLIILEEALKELSDEFYLTTDDGSTGRKGFVTDVLEELLKSKQEGYNLVYSVGPIPMMKRVSLITKDYKVKTIVSLNALMVDATGMCGCCRVTIGGRLKFVCVDGPEFDAHLVDWDELEKRNKIYEDKEKCISNCFIKQFGK